METLDLLSFEECNNLKPGDHVRRLIGTYNVKTNNFMFGGSDEEYVVILNTEKFIFVKTLDGSDTAALMRGEIVAASKMTNLITDEEITELLAEL